MKNSETFLEIIAKGENKADKNGINYLQVVVKELPSAKINPITGKLMPVIDMNPKTAKFNQWEKSYIHENQADPAYNANLGDALVGKIVTRTVADEYSFPDVEGVEVTTSTYKTVVFGDTSDEATFETAVLATFRRAGHPIAGDPMVEQSITLDEVPEEA